MCGLHAEPVNSERLQSLSKDLSKKLDSSEIDRDTQFTGLSYTLPQGSDGRRRRTESQARTLTEDGDTWKADTGRKLLMFHGIILRSQLIELLKHKAFFDEEARVSIQLYLSHFKLP